MTKGPERGSGPYLIPSSPLSRTVAYETFMTTGTTTVHGSHRSDDFVGPLYRKKSDWSCYYDLLRCPPTPEPARCGYSIWRCAGGLPPLFSHPLTAACPEIWNARQPAQAGFARPALRAVSARPRPAASHGGLTPTPRVPAAHHVLSRERGKIQEGTGTGHAWDCCLHRELLDTRVARWV